MMHATGILVCCIRVVYVCMYARNRHPSTGMWSTYLPQRLERRHIVPHQGGPPQAHGPHAGVHEVADGGCALGFDALHVAVVGSGFFDRRGGGVADLR